MAANGDATKLKDIQTIHLEKNPGKPAAAQLDTESTFDSYQDFVVPAIDLLSYGSDFTSSYDFLFILIGLVFMFSQKLKKEKRTLRSPCHLEPRLES